MSPYFNDKLSLFLTEVSFETSEENQLSYFQNGYFFKILWWSHEPHYKEIWGQKLGEIYWRIGSRAVDMRETGMGEKLRKKGDVLILWTVPNKLN